MRPYRPMPAVRPRYGARRVVAVAAFAVAGVAPPIGLWTYADSADATALRGEVPITVAPAPLAHVATPILSARRLPGTVAGADPAKELRAQLAGVPLGEASCLSVAVDGAVVFSVRPDVPVVPASNLKLLTGAAALDILTPTYTFLTTATAQVPPDATGTVAGDLFLVGGGDPVLATPGYRDRTLDAEHQGVPYTNLDDLVASLASSGVKAISGAVVGVDARYDGERAVATWPPNADLPVVSRPGALSALRVDGGLDGKGVAVADPATVAASRFTERLRQAGIAVGQPAHAGGVPADAQPLGKVSSAPLSEIVGAMLRVSDNGIAEMLVKEIATVGGGLGTTADGLAAIKGHLADWRLSDVGVSLVDGSGLSSENTVTCQVIEGIVARAKLDDPLLSGLPVAATSGTLLREFVGSPVAGQLRAKTGTLRNVRALGGVLAREGHVVQFAYVLNEPNIGATPAAAAPRWNTLATALLAFPYRPDLGAYEPAPAVAA